MMTHENVVYDERFKVHCKAVAQALNRAGIHATLANRNRKWQVLVADSDYFRAYAIVWGTMEDGQ